MTTNSATGAPTGSIYDLGYRHYEGERHGRAYSLYSLYLESLRSIFGFGRSASAKAWPLILLGLYSLLAVLQLAFSSIISQAIQQGEDIGLATYANYFEGLWILVLLFCVAQAPELVCRDQRYSVLPLYFTRSLHRLDYVLAKVSALTTALFVVLMVPMVALFVGDILMKQDALQAIENEWPKALPAIPACLWTALVMASTSLAVSSFSPRRAYAAISLFAYVMVYWVVAEIVWAVGTEAGWDWADKPQLFGPARSAVGATAWFFGDQLPTNPGLSSSLGPDAYLLSSLTLVLVFCGILIYRYRRLAA